MSDEVSWTDPDFPGGVRTGHVHRYTDTMAVVETLTHPPTKDLTTLVWVSRVKLLPRETQVKEP